MIRRLFAVFLCVMVFCLTISASVAEDSDYYQEISVNYASIAFDTGTDPLIWWQSEESLQAAFGLLVSLDLADAVPDFNLQMSSEYPSIIFGICTKEKAGTEGAYFAFLMDIENGKYFPATCDFSSRTMLCSSNPKNLLSIREARLMGMALCGENVKELSNDSIKTAAAFLQEQFAAAQK